MIDANTTSHAFAKMIEKNEYKPYFDTLNEIFCSYLNNGELYAKLKTLHLSRHVSVKPASDYLTETVTSTPNTTY